MLSFKEFLAKKPKGDLQVFRVDVELDDGKTTAVVVEAPIAIVAYNLVSKLDGVAKIIGNPEKMDAGVKLPEDITFCSYKDLKAGKCCLGDKCTK